jgi:hypothetical protein
MKARASSETPDRFGSTKMVLYLFAFFISLYVLTSSGNNYYNTDQSVLRIEVAKAIVERGSLAISRDVEGVRGIDGRNYSIRGIGVDLLAVPFYLAGKWTGIPPDVPVAMMSPFFGALTVVILFLFCSSLGYTIQSSLYVCLLYGLGTMAWPAAKHPVDNIFETFFILLSIYLLHLHHTQRKPILYAAFSLGVAFLVRQTSILVLPSLCLMMALHHWTTNDLFERYKNIAKEIVIFLIFLSPFVVLHFWYNDYRFGSVFENGYSLMQRNFGHRFFDIANLPTGLSGFLFSPGKGFFYYSPICVLFFFAIGSFLKNKFRAALCFITIILIYLFVLSSFHYWHGDWAWGPRYLFLITPLMMIPCAEIYESRSKKMILFSMIIFFASLVIQMVAVTVDFQKYFIHQIKVEKIQYTIEKSEGTPHIIEPPPEIYFQLQKSPIIFNVKVLSAAIFNREKAEYSRDSVDFWWIHKLKQGKHAVLISLSVIFLLAVAIISLSQLRLAFFRHSASESRHCRH